MRPACFQGLCFQISHFLEELPTEKPFFIFNYLGERLPAARAQAQACQMNGSFWGQYLLGFVHSKQGLSIPNYRCVQGCPGQLLMGWDPSCFNSKAASLGRIKKAAFGTRSHFHFSSARRIYSWQHPHLHFQLNFLVFLCKFSDSRGVTNLQV